jgi:membrane protein required for colicin V production
MSWIDVFIICIVGAGAVKGYFRGAIRQVALLGGLVGGFVIAKMFYTTVAEKLAPYITDASENILHFLAFLIIWIAVSIVITILARLFTDTLKLLSLNIVNKILGLVLGGAIWLLIVGLAIYVVDTVDTEHKLLTPKTVEHSLFYAPLKTGIDELLSFPA